MGTPAARSAVAVGGTAAVSDTSESMRAGYSTK